MVLIPVVIPERIRYRLLHNQVDLVLASELRRRPDVIVARVSMPIPTSESPKEQAREKVDEAAEDGVDQPDSRPS